MPILPLQAIFKPTRQVLWSLPAPPSHFRTDTPSQALWDSPVIPQQITWPSKPFSNQYSKTIFVKQSHRSSTDYLPLQAIFEPPRQSNPCEIVPSFLNRLPAPPSHFRTNMPSAMLQSRNYSSDYLPLQLIFKPTRQALWASLVIPHHITCPSKLFLNRHARRCEPVPSSLIGFITNQCLLYHKSIILCFL